MTIKIAILGGGSIARKAYLPLLRTWQNTQIVGLFSRTQQTLEEVCLAWQIDYGTTDLQALIDRQPQAAFVLTSTTAHYEHARALLAAGIDVYMEKPATESSVTARQLAELAQAKGCIYMVGFNRRFARLYCQAKEIFGERKIQLCVIEKHRPSAFHVSLYNNYLDDTIHQIDLLRYYCGDLTPLYTAFEMANGRLVGAVSLLGLAGGGRAMVLTSLQAGAWLERVSLHGGGISIEVNAFRELKVRHCDHEEVYGVDRPGRWVPELVERGFAGEIEHFLTCVHTREWPLCDGFAAARTQELVEALTRIAGEETILLPYAEPHPERPLTTREGGAS